ncbi:MAG: hypothetical protein WCV93_05615 [Candidatus Shapirobacteria bacterium]|jgi:hypothetical protein
MHYLCRTFIGPSSTSSWSQYWENEPDDQGLSSSKGHLFGLIAISSAESDLPSLGRQAINVFNQTYFSSPLSVKDSLELATKNLPSNSKVSILVVIGQTVHVFTYNSAIIILKRGQQISQFSNYLSGPIQAGDRFLLLTSEFLDFFTWDKIKSILAETRVQTIEEVILPQICSPPSDASLAASLVESFADDSDEIKNDTVSINSLNPIDDRPSTIDHHKKFHFPIFVSPMDTRQTARHRRLNLIIGLLVIVLISASAIVGFRRNRASSIDSKYKELKSALDTNIQNAQSVRSLDPDSALKLVSTARGILDQMALLRPNSEIDTYKEQLTSFSGKLGSTADFNPEVFYDTSLLATNPDFNYLFSINNGLGVASLSQGRVDFVDPQNLSKASLATGLSLAGFGHFFPDQKLVLALSSSTINKLESATSTPIFTSSVGELVSAQTWNRNIYFLAKTSPYLYKLQPRSGGYGLPLSWATSKIDFTPVSLAIDGQIYLLGSDCRIRRFDRGQSTDFISVPVANCQNPHNLSLSLTSKELSFINGSSEVYLIDAKGQIGAVYKLKDKTFLSVAIDGNYLYLLTSDQKISRLPL